MIDPTAPLRHNRLMQSQINLPDLELPAPQMPGCERIDVYLKQRGWPINPRDVEIRDEVWLSGFYGWSVYESKEGTTYWDASPFGTLRPNERPVIIQSEFDNPTAPELALHIKVMSR